MTNNSISLWACLALACVSTAEAGPITPKSLFSDAGGGNTRTGDGFSLGTEFTVSASNLLVTALGFFDLSGTSLMNSHEVGLWDVTSGDTMIADATVPIGASNGGTPGFVFVGLGSPVALNNGDVYKLATYYSQTSTDDLKNCCQGAAPTTDPNFTSVSGAYRNSTTVGHLSEPDSLAGHAYVGPNLQYTISAAPEPGTLVLTGFALLGAAMLRRHSS